MVRRITKQVAVKLLSDVEPAKNFYLFDGRIISNLEQLKQVLAEINDEQFSYHRNHEKNDFYNWIKNVVGDVKLANDIARAKTKHTTLQKIENRLDYLKKRI